MLYFYKNLNNSFNTFKFTLKKYVILKKVDKSRQHYYNDLEDKIIELSLNLKRKNNELNEVIDLNNLIFKKLIHNLKNPIGVSFSFSEMILEGLPNYNPDRLKSHIEIIKNSTEFSLNLLNRLADFSRYQLPDMKFIFQTQNFTKVLKEIIEKAQTLANEKEIKIISNLPENDIFLNFDKDELSIALFNIINNSIRFSEEKSIVNIHLTEDDTSVKINVIDNGLGISEKDIPAIFNEFYVVNTYSNDNVKCIGLGLSIANKVIKKHHGKISVQSELEKGAVFTITLPKET